MSNGDLITLDYQFQLHNTLYGRGQNGVYLDNKTIEGFGIPDAKTQDVNFTGRDGSYGNPDYVSVRQITIPAMVKATTEATAMTSLKALSLIWVPQTADTDLAFKLPGWGKFYVNGRPRGAKFDLALERRGVIRVLLRFDALDPTITYL